MGSHQFGSRQIKIHIDDDCIHRVAGEDGLVQILEAPNDPSTALWRCLEVIKKLSNILTLINSHLLSAENRQPQGVP